MLGRAPDDLSGYRKDCRTRVFVLTSPRWPAAARHPAQRGAWSTCSSLSLKAVDRMHATCFKAVTLTATLWTQP